MSDNPRLILRWDEFQNLRNLMSEQFPTREFPDIPDDFVAEELFRVESRKNCVDSIHAVKYAVDYNPVIHLNYTDTTPCDLITGIAKSVINTDRAGLQSVLANEFKSGCSTAYIVIDTIVSYALAYKRENVLVRCDGKCCRLSQYLVGSCKHIRDKEQINNQPLAFGGYDLGELQNVLDDIGYRSGLFLYRNGVIFVNRAHQWTVIRRAIQVWLGCAKRLGIMRDIRCYVGKILWNMYGE